MGEPELRMLCCETWGDANGDNENEVAIVVPLCLVVAWPLSAVPVSYTHLTLPTIYSV